MNEGTFPPNAAAGTATLRIAIVGGGFSGAAVAYHLLRAGSGRRLDILIAEPRPELGRGVAYSHTSARHLINVPATRMILDSGEPEAFDAWLRAGGEAANGDLYPPREVFGRFVAERLRAAAASASRATLKHIPSQVIRLTPGPAYGIHFADGHRAEADVVVLATGHTAARLPAALTALKDHPRVVATPWSPRATAFVRTSDRVLILGTGLTMGDMLASLAEQGHRGPVVALSRRGLQSQPRAGTPQREDDFSPPFGPLSHLLHRIRERSAASGGEWPAVVETLRQQNRSIWTAWTPAERARFLRHLKPWWDTHRFRSPPAIHGLVSGLAASGRLRLVAGRIAWAKADRDLVVAFRPRGAHASLVEIGRFDVVLNATGPGPAEALAGNPVLASLAAAGLARPDPYGLGIDVDQDGRVRGADGRVVPALHALGPPARSGLAETSGTIEIASQARALAETILAEVPATTRPADAVPNGNGPRPATNQRANP